MDNNFSMNWMDSWTDLQKKMWNDWSSVSRKSVSDFNPTTNPFNFFQNSMEDSADPMWAAFSPFQVKSPEEMARSSMMGAFNNFMNMSKGVFDTFQNLSGKTSATAEDWTQELDANLKKFREYFMSADQSDYGSLNMVSHWNKMLENMPGFSDDMIKQFMSGQGMGSMQNMLNVPGLGLNREKQEKIQKAIQLGIEYQKVMGEFQTVMNKSSLKAADLFKSRLLEMARNGKPMNNLRDLHVLWVDCNEETNADTVSSKVYQEINPRLTTALFSLKKHLQSMTDDMMTSMNMPSRKELNSAYLQIHELKRKVRSLEAAIKSQAGTDESAKINRIRDDLEQLDITSLRQDVEELKKQLLVNNQVPASKETPTRAPAVRKPRAKPAAESAETTATKTSAKKGA
ncbi:MAG: class III poly(R)-hydroxyalkanoic acid synthase subunit PhaE [Magnetococcales bacterium]|nr:class III poly(R)-hydroxyalkanoic acid synthase subunit PhaE [Magnetococcales bacterium]